MIERAEHVTRGHVEEPRDTPDEFALSAFASAGGAEEQDCFELFRHRGLLLRFSPSRTSLFSHERGG